MVIEVCWWLVQAYLDLADELVIDENILLQTLGTNQFYKFVLLSCITCDK